MAWRRIYILPKQAPSALQKWDRMARGAARQAMIETAMFGTTMVERQIGRAKPYKPVATNTYRQAWVVKKTKTGAILGNPTIQSIPVEVGKRKGKAPPFKAILEWVRVKKLVKGRDVKSALRAKEKKRGKRTRALARKTAQANRRKQMEADLAWAVVKKIKRHGIKGRYILLQAMPPIQKFSKREMRYQLKEAAKRYKP